MSQNKNKLNTIKLIYSPLFEQYKNEIRAINLPTYHNVLYKNNMGIITHININNRFNIHSSIYLDLMAIQEKYKIFYTLTINIYDRPIFNQINSSKYINDLQLTISTNILLINKDIRFIYNSNIKKLSLMSHVGNDIIDDIISNIRIKSLYISTLHLETFYKILQALDNSKLRTLRLTTIKFELSPQQVEDNVTLEQAMINITQPMITIIDASHIKLKRFILPLSHIPNTIIDALS